MRIIALDIHRSFAELAIYEKNGVRSAGRIQLEHQAVARFARSLTPDDHVVMEATGNTAVVARLLAPHVAWVVIAHPNSTRKVITSLPARETEPVIFHHQGSPPHPVRERTAMTQSGPLQRNSRKDAAERSVETAISGET